MNQKVAILVGVFILPCLFLGGCSAGKSAAKETVSGTIETDEVHVASRYGGRVASILAQEGDTLQPGQVIAKLEAPELRSRKEFAAAQLAELKAGPREQEIAAAKSDWEAMAAELDFASSENKRIEDLFKKTTVAETERDRALAKVRSLEKSAAAAKSRYELLLAGTRPERLRQVEAQLAEIETQIRELEVSAPTNSVLEALHVKPGDVLTPNREIATLLLPEHLWVRVYVPATWIGQIKLGERVEARPDSAPGTVYQGEVEQISREAEFTPRNVQTAEERIKQVFGIKIRLRNERDELRAGMSAQIVFPGLNGNLRP